MIKLKLVATLGAFLLLLAGFTGAYSQSVKKIENAAVDQGFLNPDNNAKPWAFFWWFNGYVDKPSITKHLEELKAKGLGGVILYNSESASIPKGAAFMSPEWRELFRFTVKEAHRLGMEMGINICNGWPAGGTWMSPENNTWVAISSSQIVEGSQLLDGALIEPQGKGKLYHDVVIQAIKLKHKPQSNLVKVTASNNQQEVNKMYDGNYFTYWQTRPSETSQWLEYEYKEPQEADYLWVGANMFSSPSHIEIQRSDDGVNFTTAAQLKGDYLSQFSGGFQKAKAKYFRIVFPDNGHLRIGELAFGPKPEVERVMQLAAKAAQNNPIGVSVTPSRQQLDFVWSNLTPLANDEPINADSIIDITSKVTDGHIKWNVPPGTWKIIRVGETTNGVEAGGGPLLDYLNADASTQHFNKFMKLLIEDAGPYAGTTFKYFHEDNNEINGPYNWTPKFIADFQKLRGYDPKPYIATLTGQLVGSAETTDRFLQDYRLTVADLVANTHYKLLADSARTYGIGSQSEGGGQFLPFIFPHDGLRNLGHMDVPLAEFWESENWKENQTDPNGVMDRKWIEGSQNVDAKQAAMAGHIYGKKIVGAESFTSLGPTSHWFSTPADLRLHSNIAFCEGINRIILHSSTTTKEADGKPGYEYDAGTHFNQNTTWWKDAGPFFKFLSRCEYMLQKGLFVADVLYYNGDDIPNIVPAKHIPADLGIGYDYDACNTEVLLTRLSVKDGRLVLPDGMSYSLLVLPDTKRFNLKALQKIKQLVNDGATIIGPKPEYGYGLLNREQNDTEIKNIAAELWGNTDGVNNTMNTFGKGRVYWGKTAKEVLKSKNITSDFTYASTSKTALIDFIHRRDGDMDIYYVANRRDDTVLFNSSFRINGKQPEIWDPVTGKSKNAQAFTQKDGIVTMPLQLAPYGSTFVIFRHSIPLTTGGTRKANSPTFVKLNDVTGPYHVAFDTAWGGPASVEFAKLDDWSKRPEDGIRYFSGTAKYFKEITYSKQALSKTHGPLILDLGNVQNTARVKVNGKELGILWCPPYQIDISGALKTGVNEIEIDVTNTWVNKLTGDARLLKSERKTKTNISFSPNTQLKSSGLLGPLRLGFYE